MSEQAFDRVGNNFIAYYDKVRGYVREQLVQLNLASYLGSTALNVLDVGGGDGRDAVWLAELGHQVRLIDPSLNMTNKARARVAGANLNDSVTIERGLSEDLLRKDDKYDLILSHGVLMYLEQPEEHLSLLAKHLKLGGIASILTRGRGASFARAFHRNDIEVTKSLLNGARVQNNLGESVLTADFKTMQDWLIGSGLRVEEWRGVRIVSDDDDRNISQVESSELQVILRVEAMLGREHSTRGMGHMLHFICKLDGDNNG